MKYYLLIIFLVIITLGSCEPKKTNAFVYSSDNEVPFIWDNANIYFLLTDRFYNGDPGNDVNFDRIGNTAILRGFEGGDLKGITMKIEEGYFDQLGITALWFSPVMEQIHGKTDEGTGDTYAYHGYWAKDWTAVEPNWGTEEELKSLIKTAHTHGIRVVMDAVLNHTGPVTELDPVWPEEWVRIEPKCNFQSYDEAVSCTLVQNLPDIRTESNVDIDLPDFLLEKWEKEGRLEKELAELDLFFNKTGYPRAPKYYIIKWLLDLIKDYGIDGLRIDTARHVEEEVWAELKKLCDQYFEEWKAAHPEEVLDDNPFYMVGEVYGYQASNNGVFDFGDKKVDYSNFGFTSLINFEFKGDAEQSYEKIFAKYSKMLNADDYNLGVLNYISSHDDSYPFDKTRDHNWEAGTKLLLSPGSAQIYYGDELARPLVVEGANGDANLRSLMNWDDLKSNVQKNGIHTQDLLSHWQKLGQFRKAHPAVGAGMHSMVSKKPYYFTRILQSEAYSDRVLIGLDLEKGTKTIEVNGIFANGTKLIDYYSGHEVEVKDGKVVVDSEFQIVLLGK